MRLENTYEHALVSYLLLLLAATPFVLWAQQGLQLTLPWLAVAAALAALGGAISAAGLRARLRTLAPFGDRLFCASAIVVACLPLAGAAFMLLRQTP